MGEFHGVNEPIAQGSRVFANWYQFAADTLANPKTGWPFAGIAILDESSIATHAMEREHDDTTEEGTGSGQIFVPAGMKTVTVYDLWRAKTAPPAVRTVGRIIAGMSFGTIAEAWTNVQMEDIDIPASTAYVPWVETFTLAELGMTAGAFGQLAVYRDPTPVGGTNLVGFANHIGFLFVFRP